MRLPCCFMWMQRWLQTVILNDTQLFHDEVGQCPVVSLLQTILVLLSSRFILRTVSFNCLLNEGKSSLILGCLHLLCVCVWLQTQTDKDSSRCGYGYEVRKSGKAANEGDADMIPCSFSKLCPNYILPKAIVQPSHALCLLIGFFSLEQTMFFLFSCRASWLWDIGGVSAATSIKTAGTLDLQTCTE